MKSYRSCFSVSDWLTTVDLVARRTQEVGQFQLMVQLPQTFRPFCRRSLHGCAPQGLPLGARSSAPQSPFLGFLVGKQFILMRDLLLIDELFRLSLFPPFPCMELGIIPVVIQIFPNLGDIGLKDCYIGLQVCYIG